VNSFADSLSTGQLGESLIAQWLRRRGWHVLPAYEKELGEYKGPRLFMAMGCESAQLIAPDLFTMRNGDFRWIEAKHKTHFSWYNIGKRFVTGIDLRHYGDYCRVADATGVDVWLMFLHRDENTWREDVIKWGAPSKCPTGLFGNRLSELRKVENRSHISDKHGPSGMIYWAPGMGLKKLADLCDVMPELMQVAA
jgi:hypothetical protein